MLVLALAAAAVVGLACEGSEPGGDARGPGDATTRPPATTDRPQWPDLSGLELPADWDAAHPTFSPNARLDVHAAALLERALGPSSADRAGRVRLERVERIPASGEAPSEDDELRPEGGDRPRLPASSRARFTLSLEVGAPGVVEGGSLFALPDPFWLWSEAQTDDPARLGYTTARLLGADPGAGVAEARLVPGEAPGSFRVEGRALAAGERIEIVYGAGTGGAQVDRYAEAGSAIRIGLDADGDGRRAWLDTAAEVDILAGPADRLVAFGPAEVAPGGRFELNLALVDAVGNHAVWPKPAGAGRDGTDRALVIESRPDAPIAPASGLGRHAAPAIELEPLRLSLVAPDAPGTLRLRVRGEGELARFQAELPPIVVRRSRAPLVWADLHGHSAYSDGTGTPDAYFRYARDVARLDVAALTDHDHWGIEPLDASPTRRDELLASARAYHDPGRFVTLPGYEWTSWLHGHRHVLSFDDSLPFFSSLDFATDRPDELWAALRGRPALTFAHHSAGEPVATDWHFAPDPELEPVTEIASVHGMSEALDAPAPIAEAIPGNFVRDVLVYGARLGFIGSGDSHDGHPGLAAIAAGQGGLAGLFSESLDRAPLREALERRHVFATNGIRPWLEVSIDGAPMGSTLAATDPSPTSTDAPPAAPTAPTEASAEQILRVRYEGTAPVERVELIRTGRIARLGRADLDAADERPSDAFVLERRIPRLRPGEFHYVRIVQTDGGVAWSSPIFAEATGPTEAAPATTGRNAKRPE
ncbi:MAG: DUF3604 domain-containing protein [Myxococcota bacterium]